MSLLAPERTPVTVYRWDDTGAPVLNRTAGSMTALLKTCLVTGYGAKPSAGWANPFNETGVTVLRSPVTPRGDFYLQLSADGGKNITTKVFSSMTDANTGTLSLYSGSPLGYGWNAISGKWVLFVSPYGFKLFFESANAYGSYALNRSGGFLFLDVPMTDADDSSPLIMQHSVTTRDNSGDHVGLFSARSGSFKAPVLSRGDSTSQVSISLLSQFSGYGDTLNNIHLSTITSNTSGFLYIITGIFGISKTSELVNYSEINMIDGEVSRRCMVLGVSSFSNEFVCVDMDSWRY